MDYTSGPYLVIFPAGVTLATFSIPITDDNILEGVEHFMPTINSTLPISIVTVGNLGEATVFIGDIDCKHIVVTQ